MDLGIPLHTVSRACGSSAPGENPSSSAAVNFRFSWTAMNRVCGSLTSITPSAMAPIPPPPPSPSGRFPEPEDVHACLCPANYVSSDALNPFHSLASGCPTALAPRRHFAGMVSFGGLNRDDSSTPSSRWRNVERQLFRGYHQAVELSA